MSAFPTIQSLARFLSTGEDKTAVIAFQKDRSAAWTYHELSDHAHRLADGLIEHGLNPGTHVLLYAPNSPEWLLSCLAVLLAGSVPVPVDSQIGVEDLEHIVRDCETQWVMTTGRLGRYLDQLGFTSRATVIGLDAEPDVPASWRAYMTTRRDTNGKHVGPEDPAILFYTSGTSGRPKGVPLTHHNLASNLQALLEERVVRRDDRVLLPLPFHHVYPFMVGLLAPLATRATIVLPYGLTGPQLLRALQEAEGTAIIGVPRLYAALLSAIERRIHGKGRPAIWIFHALLACSTLARRRFGANVGRRLFAPIHKQIAPRLRALASGGAALDPKLAWALQGLGWDVGTGYGLTETSPILTFNPPGQGRLESAGRPLPNVQLKIGPSPDPSMEHGEVLARGPNVFSGYRNMPEETHRAFTDDGYFRTGDLGYRDGDGYLHLVGRASAMIVLPGGKNIWPEHVEEHVNQATHIRESAVLDKDGSLVALLVPEAVPGRVDLDDLHGLIQQELEEQNRGLPSYDRVAEFAITFDPLPRTRLGKIRRHLLADRYETARRGAERPAGPQKPIPIEEMAPEDRQILEDPAARGTWSLMARRYADVRLTPESHLHLDLGIDSLEWLGLSLELRQATGANLDADAISRIQTVRDLLREAAEAGSAPEAGSADPREQLLHPDTLLDREQQRWLQPRGAFLQMMETVVIFVDRLLMQRIYRLHMEGVGNLPREGSFILTPNHLSLLDAPAIIAALPDHHLRRMYWSGFAPIMFSSWPMRLLSRIMRVMPIDPKRGALANLAFAAAALKRGGNLSWFPEGERSHTGRLQRFQPGIGLLLRAHPMPVIPVWIAGTYEALPRHRRWPRIRPLAIRFGMPVSPEQLGPLDDGDRVNQRLADAIHDRVVALGAESPHANRKNK